ncbi:MAG TPA: acyl-CoA dehydrogenase [Burkholderiaceae bacterium]|nr:acyl-CoA dehydrogenase [Burkholderiaceae bacterium]
MENPFVEPVERLFAEVAVPVAVRDVEEGGSPDTIWRAVEASGFLDALVPESAGGAGLGLSDAFPLLMLAGRHAVPVPFVQTLLARAWLAAAGVPAPDGPIALAGVGTTRKAGAVEARNIGFARVAAWVLADLDGGTMLLPVSGATIEPTGGRGSLDATLRWPAQPDGAREVPALPAGSLLRLRDIEAAAWAALIAGAADRALSLTLDYAGQRTQFGKAIGRFQAVQNQISVMAEQAWAARMAAQMACHGPGWQPRPLLAALGKSRCSEAAPLIADIAHAVHGAIGITDEYDLQLYTRRLRAWRLIAGSESYWATVIGEACLRQPGQSALSFIVDQLSAEQA